MLANMLQRFISEQYDFATRERIAQSDHGFSPEMWNRYAEQGALGALFTEADGGLGGAGFDLSVVFKALGRGLVVEPFLGALLAGSAITDFGNDVQKATIGSIIDGSLITAFAHQEPNAFYALAHVETRATREGDTWVLNGTKAVIAHAEHAELLLVSACRSHGVQSPKGISLFLVPADTPGPTVSGYTLIDGGRAAELTLNNVRVNADALLGQADNGYLFLECAVARGLLALRAEAVGIMEFMREATLEYLRTRKQFGVPIGSFQALQHRMADVLLEIEQARSSVINAAATLEGERHARERVVSAAKFTISRVGALVAEECIQLHGGIAMTWELPLAHYAKRLLMIDHELGDEGYHLERYIELGRT